MRCIEGELVHVAPAIKPDLNPDRRHRAFCGRKRNPCPCLPVDVKADYFRTPPLVPVLNPYLSKRRRNLGNIAEYSLKSGDGFLLVTRRRDRRIVREAALGATNDEQDGVLRRNCRFERIFVRSRILIRPNISDVRRAALQAQIRPV